MEDHDREQPVATDTNTGGRWQGPDGRWYRADAPHPRLRRGPDGSVVLEKVPADEEPDPGHSLEAVGGPIRPTPTIYFGRPPGTENRRAGAAALVGAALLALAVALPWAVRDPAAGGLSSLGWRDANGGVGPAWVAGLLAAGAVSVAVAALVGRTDPWLRVADLGLAAAALGLAVVEGIRIVQAGAVVDDLTGGRIELRPSWGLVAVAAGAVALGVAGALHRSRAPAWRRA